MGHNYIYMAHLGAATFSLSTSRRSSLRYKYQTERTTTAGCLSPRSSLRLTLLDRGHDDVHFNHHLLPCGLHYTEQFTLGVEGRTDSWGWETRTIRIGRCWWKPSSPRASCRWRVGAGIPWSSAVSAVCCCFTLLVPASIAIMAAC